MEMASAVGDLLKIEHASFAAHPDSRFSRFLCYWAGFAAGRGTYPHRGSIDPIRLGADLLPNVFLVDIVQNDLGRVRYRYRLLGEAIIAREGTRRGSYLDELASADTSEIERQYEAAASGNIFLRRSTLAWQSKDLDHHSYSVVALPLADNGTKSTHLLGLCLYDA